MLRLARIRCGTLIPTRWSWVRLVAATSSYLLVLALAVTVGAKAHVVQSMKEPSFWPARLVAAAAPDIAVFLGLAALCALAEHTWRHSRFVTTPIALATTVLATLSAVQLWITGEQLSAQVLALALERFSDLRAIARASFQISPLAIAATLAALVLVPAGARSVLRRFGQPLSPTADAFERASTAGIGSVLALLLTLVVPVPDPLAGLYRNAVVHTTWDVAAGERSWNGEIPLFAGYTPHDLVDQKTIDALRSGRHPNLVVIILESVRRDATTLSSADAHAKTPHLVELAARGIEVTHARAVIPHTTKSMWSMFCGRLPILQPKLYETTSLLDVQCLPHILDAAGWRTGFLQTAIGRFEDRPRLARRLGFREFVAAEQYTKSITGYLSTDDHALVAQLEKWLDKSSASPFMVTLLTSATHHPYLLTEESAARATTAGLPASADRDRYDRQIEASDAMIGDVMDLLARRGLLQDTIVVALGDHGEGFGEKAARQHAMNFYEEGLRVPWVIAGPGVPSRRIDANSSLLDLAPTLLDLFGVQLSTQASAATPARSVLRLPDDRVLPFSCFFEQSCFGFVVEQTKVVMMRELGHAFAFDLESDPDERRPLPVTSALAATLARVQHTIDLHRTSTRPAHRDPMPDFWPWNCPFNQPCGIKN